MPTIHIPKEELLRNTPLEKGWYGAQVVSCEAKKSSAGDSINFIYRFKLDVDGRTQDHNFNSKAIGMIEPFLKVREQALGRVYDNAKDYDVNTDEDVGMKLDLKLTIDVYEGRPLNKVEGFAPYGTSKAPAPF